MADLRGSDPRSEDGLLKPDFFFQHLELHKEPVFFFVAFHRLAFSAALKEAEATP